MNKEIYNNNSANNLQQKVQGASAPCKHSWNSIYNNFHPIRRMPSVTICIILASFLFFTGYVNTKKSGSNIQHTQLQLQTLSATQHNKTITPFTKELSSEVKEDNMAPLTFMQITILSNN